MWQEQTAALICGTDVMPIECVAATPPRRTDRPMEKHSCNSLMGSVGRSCAAAETPCMAELIKASWLGGDRALRMPRRSCAHVCGSTAGSSVKAHVNVLNDVIERPFMAFVVP